MNPKILVIEDNENNRYLAQFLLERAGCTVVPVENGLKGLEAAAGEKPDLILMDVQMPVMDGYETADRLRKNPETADIPIIGVSSFAMPEDRARAEAHGLTGYIEKPINPERFAEEVLRYLKKKGSPS